jgi:hypothetical protein
MPKLIDRKQEQRFFGLFVGRHHSGKTVAAASFPKPIDFEDFDGRIGGAQVPWLDLTNIDYTYWPPKAPDLIGKLNAKLDLLLTQAQLDGASQIVKLPKTHVTDSITNQTYAFLCQALGLTHMKAVDDDEKKKRRAGRWIGSTAMAGPEDYGLQAQATYDYIAFLKSLPIQNVIISGHLVDMYGFDKDEEGVEMPYAPRVITGQKLSITDKIGENIQTHFDHVFRFERDINDKFFVYFRGGIACTSYSWLPPGRHEWTGKPFYEFMMSFKEKNKDVVPGVQAKRSG